MIALTLFKLKKEKTAPEYVLYSQDVIKQAMAAMPSVKGFRDAVVIGTLDGSPSQWDLVEIIDVTSAGEFARDNAEPPGSEAAADWLSWVDNYVVLFGEEIEDRSEPVFGAQGRWKKSQGG
jgi:hypothetical protein